MGGACAFADHVSVGDGARLGGRTGVTTSIPAGETHLGLPNAPAQQTLRQWAAIRKLPGLLSKAARRGAGAGQD